MSYLYYIAPLLPFLFGFFYRCRGGFLTPNWGTQGARILYWALPVIAVTAPISWMMAVPCGMLAFLGLLIPHGWAQNDTKPIHIIGMAGIGLIRFALILAPLAAFNNPFIEIFALAGLLSGLAYYIGWKWLNGFAFWVMNPTDHFAIGGAEWGECGTGIAYGLGFAGVYVFTALTAKISFILRILEWL